ncbi:uncharacterized protein LOC6528269 [Drosophila yakuba]|uniref:Uncharacterized protein n=1 Tax=Drosophila yakuba TaxID=7245 RepID=B4P0W0_DROYA|nr:uncharacterized protein LOC6528269 [Drosophila yakuba]EDW89034.2 uncharacterized protein Dyak_GE19051 [Drosophila yakuba]
MSETNNTRSHNITLEKEESPLVSSSGSVKTRSNSSTLELEVIVEESLKQIGTPPNYDELTLNSIVDAIMPKIKNKLMGYDAIEMELQNIQKSLDTYSQQMKAVDGDIAEIFLDLHNIYKRLEGLNKSGRKLCSTKKAILLRHVKESEDLLSRSRRYLTNDPKEMSAHLVGPPTEVPSIPKDTANLEGSSKGST